MPLYRAVLPGDRLSAAPPSAPTHAPDQGDVDRIITVRFDANTAGEPLLDLRARCSACMTVKIGEQTWPITAPPTSPTADDDGHGGVQRVAAEAARYFNKIQCFCFTRQTLKPGETRRIAGGLLRRSGDCSMIPTLKKLDDHHAVLHVLSGG